MTELENQTRETGTPYARLIFIKATDAFTSGDKPKYVGDPLWTPHELRVCLAGAAIDLDCLRPHDLPECLRPDFAELMALLTFKEGPDGSYIESIRKMSQAQLEYATGLISAIAIQVGALEMPKEMLN